VATVSDFQDAGTEVAMKALNAIAIQDGKESTAIFLFAEKIATRSKDFVIRLVLAVAMQDGKERTVLRANHLSDVDTDHVKEQWNVFAMRDGKALYVKSLSVTTIV